MSRMTCPFLATLMTSAMLFPGWMVTGRAQTFTVLHRFKFTGGGDGGYPTGTLIRDRVGNLYGTASSGDATDSGILFKLDSSGKEKVLHRFSGPDGATPYAGLTQDAAGNIYGTTYYGGGGAGVVFKIDSTGTETVLYSFGAYLNDGIYPFGGVFLDSAGNLYGTTQYGGVFNDGIVYKIDPNGVETVLCVFNAGCSGKWPYDTPVSDSAGNLYGTAAGIGGQYSLPGLIFKVEPGIAATVLYNFTGGADGMSPYAGVTRDSAGDLYGTTYAGGIAPKQAGYGVVYKLSASGTFTVLHTFTGGADGANPYAGVVEDAAGNLFGATYYGGTAQGVAGYGVIFKIDAAGAFMVLHTFTGGADGANPYGGLVVDPGGNLYGTTYYGGIGKGAKGFGVVFKIAP